MKGTKTFRPRWLRGELFERCSVMSRMARKGETFALVERVDGEGFPDAFKYLERNIPLREVRSLTRDANRGYRVAKRLLERLGRVSLRPDGTGCWWLEFSHPVYPALKALEAKMLECQYSISAAAELGRKCSPIEPRK